MLKLALLLLIAAALMGIPLGFFYMRECASRSLHPTIPAVHGIVGAASLAVLLAAIDHPPVPRAMGTAGFGRVGAALLALSLLLGLAIVGAAWRCRRPSGVLVGAHACSAIAGLVLLLALIALG
jgi:hypothetical protein